MSKDLSAPLENIHILIVDDDERICKLLGKYLIRHMYRVTIASDGLHARRLLANLSFDLIILDIMMPGESGLDVAEFIHNTIKTPVILLTALGGTQHRIKGLQAGADDYLPKPFEPQELLLRINAVLKRSMHQPVEADIERIIKIGELQYNPATAEVAHGEIVTVLTTVEVTIMELLIEKLQEPVSRQTLLAQMKRSYDENDPSQERAIDVQITRLRRKIEPDIKKPTYLRTVRGKGYMLTNGS